MQFIIEKNVPAPDQTPRAQAILQGAPVEQMEVGDSFVFPLREDITEPRAIRQLAAALRHHGRPLGMKFICRVIEPGKARVWRRA
jgi:hypothetical protein